MERLISMVSKFKPGDYVKCINPPRYGYLKKNFIYRIQSNATYSRDSDSKARVILTAGYSQPYFFYRFVLIIPTEFDFLTRVIE